MTRLLHDGQLKSDKNLSFSVMCLLSVSMTSMRCHFGGSVTVQQYNASSSKELTLPLYSLVAERAVQLEKQKQSERIL